ncbi:hypothetical protein MCOR27_006165 [Pyricularia oryzae]|uniref:FAD-binding domain-containing protein n=4 Tax=Pyricularia TaxID=48558 RepID=A0ABQ8NAM3_PYRGI|nr:uncharacterized protein MGG_06373 [Pyricularia oryzae 70-15]ELQ44157.1 oxidoreductase [Pyricularia oryzae Y34]KAH8843374.1 hypothetical protein MCOR01_004191 [Pyricularia oryzae]KAI6294031.1 hypothetical protein MCOR33_008747 [Pyricularia grisea]EHA50882.1 hypothetical protein MGG_06373 [Pyricularia oryzae 70-15]KAH9430843.1 hypothetical protein MCOR02_008170 [Pyricularia oryzae]
MSSPRILISGSGIAGSSFAYWMLRAFPTAAITMVERCPTFRLTGSSVDLRSSAIDICKRMNMLDTVKAHTTTERGIRFVNSDGSTVATLGASGRSDVQGITSEYEIFRSDLARIILEPSRDKINILFDDYVDKYETEKDGVKVTFAKSKRVDKYDLLVAADGVGSRIRGQMLNSNPREQVHDEGVHVAYFTQKSDLLNGSKFAEGYSAPGGRVIMVRPDPHPEGRSKVIIMNVTTKNDLAAKKRLNDAVDAGNEAYMALLEETFADVGHRSAEVLKGMRESDDFYCSLFAQVRSPKLVDQSGRVVLLGDAGYATPGIGTSLAMIGAYVLAGELLSSTSGTSIKIPAATSKYQDLMVPFVKSHQGDDNAMQILNPQTSWGIMLRDVALRVVTGLWLDRLAMIAAAKLGFTDKMLDMPEYAWPKWD